MSNKVLQQLRGLAKGILASGEPSAADVTFLKQFFNQHSELSERDDLTLLATFLRRTDKVNDEALGELMGLLIPLQSIELEQGHLQAESPVLYFPFSRFTVIGSLSKTTRGALEEHLNDQAAELSDSLSAYTDYVVLADKPRTAEKAKVEQLRAEGYPLAIVDETELCEALTVFEDGFDDSAENIVQWVVSLAQDMTARLPEGWVLAQQDDRLSFGVYRDDGHPKPQGGAVYRLSYRPNDGQGEFAVESPALPQALYYANYPFAMARFYKEVMLLIEP